MISVFKKIWLFANEEQKINRTWLAERNFPCAPTLCDIFGSGGACDG